MGDSAGSVCLCDRGNCRSATTTGDRAELLAECASCVFTRVAQLVDGAWRIVFGSVLNCSCMRRAFVCCQILFLNFSILWGTHQQVVQTHACVCAELVGPIIFSLQS